MKVSTKGRYALRLMLDLAINYDGTYTPLKEIAKRQEISDKYLEQIIIQLNKSGLVKSVRGSQGGYMLSRSAEEYTVGDILRVMEGSLSPVTCLDDENNQCSRSLDCATLVVWQKLKTAIDDVVDSFTLADLVKLDNSNTSCQYQI